MSCVFYDLETTDLNFCGQILNYAFLEIDEEWNIVSELCGNIKLSRTQLPSAGAVLTNRVDISKHNGDSEFVAMQKIRQYLDHIVLNTGHLTLIGYNSSRFDNHYLRTSMIRNGIDPYFSKNITNRDVLHACQKLAVVDDEFRKIIGCDGENRPQLKLNVVTDKCGIRDHEQLHESKDDVLMTITLAKHLSEVFDLDIRTWQAYEPKNTITFKVFPEWDAKYHLDPDEDNTSRSLMIQIDRDRQYSLWLNVNLFLSLKKRYGELTYEQRKSCVSWYNAYTSRFFVSNEKIDPKLIALAEKCKEECLDVKLDGFFPPKNCDPEEHIYGITFNGNRALADAIHNKDLTRLKEFQSNSKLYSQLIDLYHRFKVANSNLTEYLTDYFRSYCLYRYGGQMKVDQYDTVTEYKEGVYHKAFHPTYNELYEEIEKELENPDRTQEDISLLEGLKSYYDNSDIYNIAGKDLITINRVKQNETT